MSAVVRFSPTLGKWITGHLERGAAPAELAEALRERSVAAPVARAIVDAFVQARRDDTPVPVDMVSVPTSVEAAPDVAYRPDLPRLPAGSSIATCDRIVRVAARAERPALAVLANVLDAEECDELIAMARPRLRPSTIVDPASGRDVVVDTRGSFGMFFLPGENALVRRLDRRFADVFRMATEHGEGLQVLHYPVGAGSAPHFDFLSPANDANRASIARSGQRVATLVAYLNDVPSGGETIFPPAGWSVSPQRGNAVAFEYADAAGNVDHFSLHASAPVQAGEKWVATKWLRAQRFVSA